MKLKRCLTITGLFMLLIHFSFTLIFCFPQFFKNSHLLGITKRYMFPVFNQNWQMFAPEPPSSVKRMYYRCQFENQQYSGWINPGEASLKNLQRQRFWNYGKLFNIYESICRAIKYANPGKKISETPEYRLACAYITNDVRLHFANQKIHQIDFMYVSCSIPVISNKSVPLSYEVIIYPEIVFENQNK